MMKTFFLNLSVASMATLFAVSLYSCDRDKPTPSPKEEEAGITIGFDGNDDTRAGVTIEFETLTPAGLRAGDAAQTGRYGYSDKDVQIEIERVFFPFEDLTDMYGESKPIDLKFYAKENVVTESWYWREADPTNMSQSIVAPQTMAMRAAQAQEGLMPIMSTVLPIQRSWLDGKNHKIQIGAKYRQYIPAPTPNAEESLKAINLRGMEGLLALAKYSLEKRKEVLDLAYYFMYSFPSDSSVTLAEQLRYIEQAKSGEEHMKKLMNCFYYNEPHFPLTVSGRMGMTTFNSILELESMFTEAEAGFHSYYREAYKLVYNHYPIIIAIPNPDFPRNPQFE